MLISTGDDILDIIVVRSEAGFITWHTADYLKLFDALTAFLADGIRTEILGYYPNTTDYDHRVTIMRAHWASNTTKEQDQ